MSSAYGISQGKMIVRRTITASTLRGTAFLGTTGPDGNRAEKQGLEGVSVQLCDADFQQCDRAVSTDHDGRFDLRRQAKKGDVFYLRLLKPGICEEQATVRIQGKAGDIAVPMMMGF